MKSTIFLLFIFLLAAFTSIQHAQNILFYPECKVVNLISGCTPPEVKFILAEGIEEDTIKVLPGFNTMRECMDSLNNTIDADSIGFYIRGKNENDNYELYYCRDTAGTRREDLIPFGGTLYGIEAEYEIKLIIKRNGIAVDSLAQAFLGRSTGLGVDDDFITTNFKITSVYPNPFNPSTTIEYEVDKSGSINLSVYNLLGELVAQLENRYAAPGKYQMVWDAYSGQSGIYFVVLRYGNSVSVKKIILLK